MHGKFQKDGLVAISVNLDPLSEKANKDVLDFLEKTKATLVNVRLKEEPEFWGEKFGNQGALPTVFVFNRAGKYVRFPPSEEKPDFTYSDVEKVVVQFLNEK
jgi:hypothetical protein